MRATIPLHWLLFIVPFDVYHSGKSNKFHHRRSDVKKEEAFGFDADAFFRFILFSFIRPALEKYEIRNLWHLALLFRSSSLNSKSVQKEGGSTHHFHSTSSHQKRGLQQNSDFYTKLFALKESFWHFGIHSNLNRFHYSAISEWLHKVGKLGQFKKILKPEKVHDI